MGKKHSIEAGRRFGRLVVLAEGDHIGERRAFRVQCDCGTTKSVVLKTLLNGESKSCGCLKHDTRNTTHGRSGESIYNIWCTIIQRTENSNSRTFQRYGARGIRMCERWRNSFEAFVADMGERPTGMSVERLDNNGNYEPSNCRWATTKEQQRNTRRNRVLTHNGRTATVAEWAEITGIKQTVLHTRLFRGWSVEKCLETPWKRNHERNRIICG